MRGGGLQLTAPDMSLYHTILSLSVNKHKNSQIKAETLKQLIIRLIKSPNSISKKTPAWKNPSVCEAGSSDPTANYPVRPHPSINTNTPTGDGRNITLLLPGLDNSLLSREALKLVKLVHTDYRFNKKTHS